ncbi:MAG: hypothetical protein ACYDEE_05550 [Ignavibacteriaceae bacterium]
MKIFYPMTQLIKIIYRFILPLERSREYNYAIKILPIIIIIGLALMFCKSKIEGSTFSNFDEILYLGKVTSIIWLVFLPFMDYWKWAFKNSLRETIYAFPFAIFILLLFTYLIGPIAALFSEPWSNILLNSNMWFFTHTIFTLSVLFWSDNLIKKFIENEKPKSFHQIEMITIVIEQYVKDVNKKDEVEKLTEELKVFQRQCNEADSTIIRYEVTLRYADKAILVSMIFTFILYIVLRIFFKIQGTEITLYDSFFEGALIFSLIISTVIYFLIVRKYGTSTVYTK